MKLTRKVLHLKWQKSYFCFLNPNISELFHLLEFMVYLHNLHLTKVHTNVLQQCDGKWKQTGLWEKTNKHDLYHLPFFVAFSATVANANPLYWCHCMWSWEELRTVGSHKLVWPGSSTRWLCSFRLQLPNGKQGTIPSHFLISSHSGSLLALKEFPAFMEETDKETDNGYVLK